jgi:hypothetical protein
MTNGAAALFMRTAYQTPAIYFGDTPLGWALDVIDPDGKRIQLHTREGLSGDAS